MLDKVSISKVQWDCFSWVSFGSLKLLEWPINFKLPKFHILSKNSLGRWLAGMVAEFLGKRKRGSVKAETMLNTIFDEYLPFS